MEGAHGRSRGVRVGRWLMVLLATGMFGVVTASAWAQGLPTACYEPGGETMAKNEANHQEGYRRTILDVVPKVGKWVAEDKITLTSGECEAATSVYELLGLDEGKDKLFWEDVIKAILVPKGQDKRGFTGVVKLVETPGHNVRLAGTLTLNNEAAVKAAIDNARFSPCADASGRSAKAPPALDGGGGVSGLIQKMAFGSFIPKEAFETGALSLELGTHFGGHVGTGDDKKSGVGAIAGIRVPVFGGPVAAEDRLAPLERGIPLDVKCEVTPYRALENGKPGSGVLARVELVSGPWKRPQKVTDKRVGLMAGYGSEPDVFVIGPSVAINKYFRVFGASTFGDDRDGQWVFGMTINTSDQASKVLEAGLEATQGKEEEKKPEAAPEDKGEKGDKTEDDQGAGGAQPAATLYGMTPDASHATVAPAGGPPAGYCISGFVWTLQTDGAMAGIEGAHVQLMEVAEDGKAATTVAFAVSGPGGGFTIAGLDPARSYKLTASALGFPVGESSAFAPADLKELPGVRLTRPVQ